MKKPLSKDQKAKICILAREAYDYQTPDHSFEDWRRYEQSRACGKDSLTKCTQLDYLYIIGWFQSLAGRDAESFETLMKAESEEQRMYYSMIDKALRDRNLETGYAQSICMNQFKCTLEEAKPKQLRCIFITITRRRDSAKNVRLRQPISDGFSITPYPEEVTATATQEDLF